MRLMHAPTVEALLLIVGRMLGLGPYYVSSLTGTVAGGLAALFAC